MFLFCRQAILATRLLVCRQLDLAAMAVEISSSEDEMAQQPETARSALVLPSASSALVPADPADKSGGSLASLCASCLRDEVKETLLSDFWQFPEFQDPEAEVLSFRGSCLET